MGRRSFERYTDADWRSAGATVQQLLLNGWPVYGECEKCNVRVWANLDYIAIKAGPRASLWGWTPPCRVVGCPGRYTLFLRPPEATMAIAMTAKRP
ncbi:MAG TPA: hypothetical protein VN018_00520 [Brevundimonas sp.]|nr:hypothetical protein [Brevundimonas sp.]